MNWKLFILFFLYVGCSGQSTTSYTIECSSNFTIDVPPNSKDTIFNYEEGFIKTFYWRNGDILDIHCGSMNDNMYLSDSVRYKILNVIEDNQKKIIRGKEKEGKKMFGILKIKGYRVIISFLCSPDREKLFFKILNDIKRN